MTPEAAAAGGEQVVRVVLPATLRVLAGIEGEVRIEPSGAVSLGTVIDALERRHPALRNTLRDPGTGARRAFVRFFACSEDYSLLPLDTLLPDAVAEGREPVVVVGAIAGG